MGYNRPIFDQPPRAAIRRRSTASSTSSRSRVAKIKGIADLELSEKAANPAITVI